MHKKSSFWGILLTIVFLIVVSPLNAQEATQEGGLALTLSPTYINATTKPLEMVKNVISITNDGTTKETYVLSIKKIDTTTGSTDSTKLIDLPQGDTFASWVNFSEKELTLEPKQKKTFEVSITPDAGSGFGYYYAILVTRKNDAVTGSTVRGAAAIPVIVEVTKEGAKKMLEVTKFFSDRGFYEYLPANFSLEVKNTGNIHTAPYGNIFIEKGSNKNVALLTINPEKNLVLPDTTRTYTSSWDDGFMVLVPKKNTDGTEVKDAKGNTVKTVQFNWNKLGSFRMGKYTAKAVAVYNDGQRDVSAEKAVSFYVFPVRLVLTLLALILIPLYLMYAAGRRTTHHTKK